MKLEVYEAYYNNHGLKNDILVINDTSLINDLTNYYDKADLGIRDTISFEFFELKKNTKLFIDSYNQDSTAVKVKWLKHFLSEESLTIETFWVDSRTIHKISK